MRRLWWLFLASAASAGALPGYQPPDGRNYEPLGAQGANQQTVLDLDLDPPPRSEPAAISPELFALLEESARITDIAYCVGPASDVSPPFACPSRCADFPTFELITTFSPRTPLPLIDESATGYLAYDHDPLRPRLVLAFRGTYSIADAIADLGTVPQPYKPYPLDEPDSPSSSAAASPSGSTLASPPRDGQPVAPAARCDNCTVHSGFYASYLATRKLLLPAVLDAHRAHPDYRVDVSGHSLGGAIALLAALELNARGVETTLTTFGSPAVGNPDFARHAAQQLGGDVVLEVSSANGIKTVNLPRARRVTHRGDPVPGLPPQEWGYAQPVGEVRITKATLPAAPADVVVCASNCALDAGQESTSLPLPWTLVAAHRDYLHRLGLCLA